MGLQAIFQNAAKTAFGVAGDVKVKVDYVSVDDTGLDDATERTVPQIEMLKGTFSLSTTLLSKSENVLPGDVLGTILAPAFPYKPKKGDRVIAPDAIYHVEAADTDAAGATHELHLRTI